MSGVSGSSPAWSTDELRAAVRAVIREALPDGLPAAAPDTPVAVTTDAELDALVRRVAHLCEDPECRASFQEGRHGFTLTKRLHAPQDEAEQEGAMRIERGAVTERAVARAAKAGARLVLGPRAVLTPLARDRARMLGVEIEKEH
jgi:hypothetical protein